MLYCMLYYCAGTAATFAVLIVYNAFYALELFSTLFTSSLLEFIVLCSLYLTFYAVYYIYNHVLDVLMDYYNSNKALFYWTSQLLVGLFVSTLYVCFLCAT